MILPHLTSQIAYIPITHRRRRRSDSEDVEQKQFTEIEDEQTQEKNTKKEEKPLLSVKDFKSLIMTALIFLSIFAWVEVMAAFYNKWYFDKMNKHNDENRIAGVFSLQHLVRHIPKGKTAEDTENVTEDLPPFAKAGYATLLSLVTLLVWKILSNLK